MSVHTNAVFSGYTLSWLPRDKSQPRASARREWFCCIHEERWVCQIELSRRRVGTSREEKNVYR